MVILLRSLSSPNVWKRIDFWPQGCSSTILEIYIESVSGPNRVVIRTSCLLPVRKAKLWSEFKIGVVSKGALMRMLSEHHYVLAIAIAICHLQQSKLDFQQIPRLADSLFAKANGHTKAVGYFTRQIWLTGQPGQLRKPQFYQLRHGYPATSLANFPLTTNGSSPQTHHGLTIDMSKRFKMVMLPLHLCPQEGIKRH